jgi:hypothetical protein
MGIDNSAILFMGLKASGINWWETAGLTNKEAEDLDCYLDEWIDEMKEENDGLEYCHNNEGEMIVGFRLGDSDSYGFKEIENLPVLYSQNVQKFIEIFKTEPKVFLYNLQW